MATSHWSNQLGVVYPCWSHAKRRVTELTESLNHWITLLTRYSEQEEVIHTSPRCLLCQLKDVQIIVVQTALHAASLSGQVSTVKLLLEKGATVDSLDVMKHTPLFRACEMGYKDVILTLIKGGCDSYTLANAVLWRRANCIYTSLTFPHFGTSQPRKSLCLSLILYQEWAIWT